jgi:hypothetical protein
MDIDELLPFKSYSLEEFIRTAAAIRSNEDDPNRLSSFVRFVLTGRHEAEGHQVALDAIRDRIPNDLPVQVNRDYDSLIGLSDHIRLNGTPLFVSPVARTDQTLTSNVHLTMDIGEVGQFILWVSNVPKPHFVLVQGLSAQYTQHSPRKVGRTKRNPNNFPSFVGLRTCKCPFICR